MWLRRRRGDVAKAEEAAVEARRAAERAAELRARTEAAAEAERRRLRRRLAAVGDTDRIAVAIEQSLRHGRT